MKEDFKIRLLRRFVEDPERMSRNRNFHAYLDPRVFRAARIGRLLRALRADLRAGLVARAQLRSDVSELGPLVLELHYENAVRRTRLSRVELKLLLQDEEVSARLRDLLQDELVAA